MKGKIKYLMLVLGVSFAMASGAEPIGKKPGMNIWRAASSGNIEQVRRNLSSGVSANARSKAGQMPLSEAAMWGHKDVVVVLLEKGANVNAKDSNNFGWTPLHWAAMRGHKDVVVLLLKKGADINILSNSSIRETPVDVASSEELKDIMRTYR